MAEKKHLLKATKMYKAYNANLTWEGPPDTFRIPGVGPDKRYPNKGRGKSVPKKTGSSRGKVATASANAAKRNMGHAMNRRRETK